MAKQVNKTMIGGFVVLAVAILASSVVIFGSGDLFKKTTRYVLFFDGSVKGLDVGAPVLFRGVQIGQVESIVIEADMNTNETHIPILIEVDPSKFRVKGIDPDRVDIGPERTKVLIEKGLRAQLSIQSMITGKLVIEISFRPDTPIRLTNLDPTHVEIPTIPSFKSKLKEALKEIDIPKIQERLMAALAGAESLLNNPDLEASLKALRAALEDAKHLVANVDGKIDPLTDNLNTTLTNARAQIDTVGNRASTTLTSINRLAQNVDRKVDPLGNEAQKTLVEARETLQHSNRTLKTVNEDLSADSPLMVKVENTLDEFAAMARSIRLLTDYLKRHPESLLQGKGQGKPSGGQ